MFTFILKLKKETWFTFQSTNMKMKVVCYFLRTTTFCFYQMAEQSDSTTKAPKSSYKQLDELAQKNRVAVSIFLQVIYLKYYTLTTHLHKSSVLTWKRTEKNQKKNYLTRSYTVGKLLFRNETFCEFYVNQAIIPCTYNHVTKTAHTHTFLIFSSVNRT